MANEDPTQVVGVVMLVRGGDRQYFYQDVLGQFENLQPTLITQLGEQQEFQLGTLLRSIYLNVTSPSFIQDIFGETALFNQSEVIIRADDSVAGGALLDSAVALSQGLWPPSPQEALQLANGSTITSPLGGYQYIAIDSVDPNNDFSLSASPSCLAWAARSDQFIDSAAFNEKATENAQLLSSFQTYYDSSEPPFPGDMTLENMWNIYEYFNVQAIHNSTFVASFPLPSLGQLRYLTDWLEYSLYTDSDMNGVGNVAGRSLMPTILSALDEMSSGTEPLKMHISLVSYQPFLSLMNMTGVFESGNLPNSIVDFASSLIFELRNSSSGDLTVRLNFKNGTGDDSFHTYPMKFADWDGSDGEDVPLPTLVDTFAPQMIPDWYSWCTACQDNVSTNCIEANALFQVLANISNGSPTAGSSASSSSSVPGGIAAELSAHSRLSPVGAGFLGAGLSIVVLSAIFGFLIFLGVFSYSGTRRLKRFSNTSYRQRKWRVGDELELRSEVNSVVGLKMP